MEPRPMNYRSRDSYWLAMDDGARTYADALAALAGAGLSAEFTQTGGMCAALSVSLDGGYLLITDQQDSLSWNRLDHAGWCVGRYVGDEGLAQGYTETSNDSVGAMMACVQEALAGRFTELPY